MDTVCSVLARLDTIERTWRKDRPLERDWFTGKIVETLEGEYLIEPSAYCILASMSRQ